MRVMSRVRKRVHEGWQMMWGYCLMRVYVDDRWWRVERLGFKKICFEICVLYQVHEEKTFVIEISFINFKNDFKWYFI